jgi:hypothetical protein
MGASALAQWIKDWTAALSDLQRADGRTPVVPVLYCDKTYAKALYPYLSGTVKLWISDWDSPQGQPNTSGWENWQWLFHQYSGHGSVAGIPLVDLNVFNGDSATLNTLINSVTSNGLTAYTATPSARNGGIISPNSPQTFNARTGVSFTATPANGYIVDQWFVNGTVSQTGGIVFTVGNATTNENVSVSFKPSCRYAGVYRVTASDGTGICGLEVNPDGTGMFIAYLGQRGSAVVQPITVDSNGQFTASGAEIRPASGASDIHVFSFEQLASSSATVPSTNFTLSGQISGQNVSGQLAGLGSTFTGFADNSTGAAQAAAGFYSAAALNASAGTTYAVIGATGQAVVVTTTPTSVDGGTGTVNANGQLSTTTANGAKITATVDSTNQTMTASITPTNSATPTNYTGVSASVTVANRLTSISTRGFTGTGSQALIAGFVISGSAPKQVLVRATGPALTAFGVTSVLANPKLQLYHGDGTLLTENDDWSTAANVGDVSQITANVWAFPLSIGSKDSALLLTLDPGSYTAIVSGSDGSTGISLVEVYETSSASDSPKLSDISTRGQVNIGNGVLIAGFAVTGNAPKKVLVRATGPALTAFGVSGALADPILTLFDSNSVQIAQNDNWGSNGDSASVIAATNQVYAFPLSAGSKDAVLLVTLPPGAYTAQASGAGGTTGVALIEVYEVP